jgi:antitoxin component HigA of HigAB toxin-antitoxin module
MYKIIKNTTDKIKLIESNADINKNRFSIKTEQDYDNALSKIDNLMDAKPNTPQMDELEVLTTLVEAYEAKYYAI